MSEETIIEYLDITAILALMVLGFFMNPLALFVVCPYAGYRIGHLSLYIGRKGE